MTEFKVVHETPGNPRERAIAMQASQKVAVDVVRLALGWFEEPFRPKGVGEITQLVVGTAEKLYEQVQRAESGTQRVNDQKGT